MKFTKFIACSCVLLFITTTVSIENVPEVDEKTLASLVEQDVSLSKRACPTCRGVCYNPVEKQCCDDYLLHAFYPCSKCDSAVSLTCEGRCYPKTGYKCCDKKVIPNNWQCCPHHCGSTCYNAETHQCCKNVIISRQKMCCEDPAKSCGNNCYDPKLAKCCNDKKVIDIKGQCCSQCAGKCYKPGTEQCCHQKIIPISQTCCNPGQSVCGKACYDGKTHKCCHGGVIPIGQTCCNPGQSACGKACYDGKTHKCCAGRVIPISQTCCLPGQSVCGKACYDGKTHKCCHGRVIPIGQTCCNPGQSVCGKACYYKNIQKCCHNRVIFVAHTCPGHRLGITKGLVAVYVGCYRDKPNRAIPPLEGHDRLLDGNYQRRQNAIEKCALAAARRGWKYFAVQHQGWCASSPQAHSTYKKYGPYNTCTNGKGGPWGNDVYRLEGTPSVRTLDHQICVFPFIYKGVQHHQCTKLHSLISWCSLTPNYDRDKLKGNCGCPPMERRCGQRCYNTAWLKCCSGSTIKNKWQPCNSGWWGRSFGKRHSLEDVALEE